MPDLSLKLAGAERYLPRNQREGKVRGASSASSERIAQPRG